MADTINVKYKITEDGSLGKVAKDADKAAKSTKKATDATAQHNKAQKGVIGATSNSTKAFSKMTTGITGGLVPAYATLAANVFALTALFGALSKAASLRILEDGLIRVGNASGQNLTHVADGLRDITDAAISTETAMRATALAFSSGFSADQLNQLTKVAKGASVALGRDMTDALDRLVRGTAKLEPEILDELGIMVRLDDAVEKYATSLKKTGKDLTQFERRQAFLNATIEQGLKKFGQLADTAEVNPYDKLAASFANLQKVGINLLNTVVEPFVNYLSSNPVALTAAVTMFAGTIVKTLVPAISASADAARAMAARNQKQVTKLVAQTEKSFKSMSSKIKTLDFAPKSIQKIKKELQEGKIKGKELQVALRNVAQSEKLRTAALKNTSKQNIDAKKAELKSVQALRAEIEAAAAAEGRRGASSGALGKAKGMSSTSRKTAAAFKMMEGAGPIEGFKIAGASISKQMKDIGKTSGGLNKLAVSYKVAGNAAKLFGTAALNAIPVIGQIAMVASLAWPLVSKIFEKGKAAKAADEAAKSFKSFHGIAEQLTKTLALTTSTTEDFVATMRAQVGIIGQIRDGLKSANDAGAAEVQEDLVDYQEQINKIEAILEKNSTLRERRAKGEAGFFEAALSGEAIKQFQRSISTLRAEQDALRKSANQVDVASAKVILDSAISNLQSNTVLNKSMSKDITALEKVKDKIKEGMKKSELDELMKGVMGNKEKVINSIDTAKSAAADFNKEVTLLGAKNKGPFDSMLNKVNAVNVELKKAGEEGGMGTKAFFEEAPGYKEMLDNFKSKLVDGSVKLTKEQKNAGSAAQQFQKVLEDNAKTIALSATKIKGLTATYKTLGEFAKGNGEAVKAQLEVEEKIRTTKLDALDAELKNFDLLNLTDKQAKRVLEINEQQVNLGREKKETAEKSLMIQGQELVGKKQLMDMAHKQANAEAKIVEITRNRALLEAKIAKQKQGKKFTAADEKAFFSVDEEVRMKMAIANRAMMQREAVNMEYDLLEAQTKLQRERARIAEAENENIKEGTLTKGFDDVLNKLPAMRESAIGQVNAQAGLDFKQVDKDKLDRKDKARDAAIGAAGQSQTGGTGLLQDSSQARMVAFQDEGGFGALDKASEKVAAMKGLMDPMIDQLKQLGPDGELAAAVTNGALAISESFTVMSEGIEEGAGGMEKGAAMAQFAAQAIGAISQMMAANSAKKIAGIEAEIEAEKRRDGQSAASTAKVKALEAKKEQAKRKAFDQNKKMQMAQVIASTASAVMQSFANAGGFPLGMGMAVAMGAIGAAQLAMIAKTSYDGGGSAGDSGPTKITAGTGSRQSTVDLAKPSNTSGELAYMRGADGMGNIQNFKPAFTGYKNRAAGGFVVGEQGPEVFMPEVPGEIIPAGKSPGDSAPTVNFTISAVDASGVEDLLMEQRGNIIGMLREAANEHGEMFLESVKEKSL